jgi:hypothetical protein
MRVHHHEFRRNFEQSGWSGGIHLIGAGVPTLRRSDIDGNADSTTAAAHRDSDRIADINADSGGYSHSRAISDAETHTDAHSIAGAKPESDGNADPDSDRNRNPDHGTQSHPEPNFHANADKDLYTHGNCDGSRQRCAPDAPRILSAEWSEPARAARRYPRIDDPSPRRRRGRLLHPSR